MDEVGNKLRSARIEKGYTLDDLQQITKIQKRYLIAIEEGNFDQLPGDFYVRAFVKQYAETVGLDSQGLLDEYRDDIPETQPKEYAENSIENKTRVLHDETNSISNWFRNNTGKLIIGVVILVVIASLYFYAVHAANQRKTNIPDQTSEVVSSSKKTSSKKSSKSSSKSEKEESSSKSESSSSSSASSSSTTSELTIATAAGSTNTFTVSNLPATANTMTVGANGSSAWIMVTVDGTSWQSVLQSGATHEINLPAGTQTIKLQSGNTPGTTVKINNQTVTLPSGSSVVQTFTFNVEASSSDSE